MSELSASDRALLDRVQRSVPLVERPYAQIAQELSLSEADVIARLMALKESRILRQISAVFDARALGYSTCLVAASYPEDRIEQAAAILNTHPGITHNYQRTHRFNVWYTLAVAPDSRLGLDGTLRRLHEWTQAQVTRRMDALRLFKIGVQLDMSGEDPSSQPTEEPAYTEHDQRSAQAYGVKPEDIPAIRVLQTDLPLTPEPFASWAGQLGYTVGTLLQTAHRLLKHRQMRRFAALLRHHEAGFVHNCMGVWNVPDDRVDEVGRTMAAFRAVSHCYLRPRYPDWPYNLFTMVHGRSRDECLALLDDIAGRTGIRDRAELWSLREFKKTRLALFTPDLQAWEEQHAAGHTSLPPPLSNTLGPTP